MELLQLDQRTEAEDLRRSVRGKFKSFWKIYCRKIICKDMLMYKLTKLGSSTNALTFVFCYLRKSLNQEKQINVLAKFSVSERSNKKFVFLGQPVLNLSTSSVT